MFYLHNVPWMPWMRQNPSITRLGGRHIRWPTIDRVGSPKVLTHSHFGQVFGSLRVDKASILTRCRGRGCARKWSATNHWKKIGEMAQFPPITRWMITNRLKNLKLLLPIQWPGFNSSRSFGKSWEFQLQSFRTDFFHLCFQFQPILSHDPPSSSFLTHVPPPCEEIVWHAKSRSGTNFADPKTRIVRYKVMTKAKRRPSSWNGMPKKGMK